MPLMLRVRATQLQAFVKELGPRGEQLLTDFKERGSLLVTKEMRFQAPMGPTGFLRESIDRRITPKGFTVWPRAKYAIFVEEGTRPHMIFPRRAKVLRWYGPYGNPIFAKYVKHPGTKGRFFVRKTKLVTVGRLWELANNLVGEHMNFV